MKAKEPVMEGTNNSSTVVVAVEGTSEEKNEEMFTSRTSTLAPNPSWFTPLRLLILFCVINLINYIDRGAIASNGVNGSRKTCTDGVCSGGTGIQGEFNLSNFEDGVLSSAFMVGLLVASPIFASLAKSVNPFRLIGVGMSVWTIAVAGCGFSFDFWSITICRMLVGVGEASFVSLAAPFIDDNAPVSQKTAWLGIFYMCIPTGYAIGYIFGGEVGSHLIWRWAFWIEAFFMLPFAILGFVMKPLQLKGASFNFWVYYIPQQPIFSAYFCLGWLGFSPAGSKKALTSAETIAPHMQEFSMTDDSDYSTTVKDKHDVSEPTSQVKEGNQFSRFAKDMKVLLYDKVYVVNVLGYCAYNFVIGAYSYWGPKAGHSIYNMTNADMIFGGITVVCGIVGSIAGGMALDYITSTISNAFKLLSAGTFLGAIFFFSGFCFKSMYGFLVFFSVGELLAFVTQAPVNFVCLHCVKPSLRPLAMAMSTVAIHVFGDVPSSPLVGILEDGIDNWRKTALILTSILFVAAVLWFIGIFLHATDRFNDEEGERTVTVNHTPPLKGNKGDKVESSAAP